MKYFILAQILFLTSLVGFAQQVMLADSITKNPVCYATVYDANGTVIGRSDMGGCINLQKGFEYHISHISYEPRTASFSCLHYLIKYRKSMLQQRKRNIIIVKCTLGV